VVTWLEPRIPGLSLSYPPAGATFDGLEYQSTSCWNFCYEDREFIVATSKMKIGNTDKYGLLTKCKVKMAGYWPSSFFACLWTETESSSINKQKKNEANIQSSWPNKLAQ